MFDWSLPAVPIATCPQECGSLVTAALIIEKQVEWKKMNYVNLHWLKILLEHLGILVIKNKSKIFLHWKTIEPKDNLLQS